MGRDERRRQSSAVAFGLGLGVLLVGAAVAVLAPATLFVWFRKAVIVVPHPATEPFVLDVGHRISAAVGALLGGIGLSHLYRSPVHEDVEGLSGRWGWATCGVFACTVVLNLRYAGVRLGLWSFWLPWVGQLYFPLTGAFVVSALLGLGLRPWRTLDRRGLLLATTLGAAYGAFSSLWHCCAPLWTSELVPWPLAALAVPLWATALSGFTTALALRAQSPLAEGLSASLFAFGYPWHSIPWFAQGLVGGVFFVLLARRANSTAAPGVFISTAYLVHTTIPFWVS